MKAIPIALLALVILAGPAAAQQAATHDQEETLEGFMALLRQDLKQRRNAALRGILKFETADQARNFAPLQNSYDEELAAIDEDRRALLEEFGSVHDQLTPTQAESLGDRFFRLEKRSLGLQEKYYRRISDEVSTIIAVQFLQIQRQYDTLGAMKLASRTPIASDGSADGLSQTEILDGYLEAMKKNINTSRDKALAEIVRLEGDQAKVFQSLKKEYDKEFAAQRRERRKLLQEYSQVAGELTPDVADSLAARVLAQYNDRVGLHEDYLKRVSEELSPVVAVQFLQVQYRFETMADLKAASYVPIAGL
jgi:hypothetical protein